MNLASKYNNSTSYALIFNKVFTLSYQVIREMAPVYTMGSRSGLDRTGNRGIAGSVTFTNLTDAQRGKLIKREPLNVEFEVNDGYVRFIDMQFVSAEPDYILYDNNVDRCSFVAKRINYQKDSDPTFLHARIPK